VTEWEAAGVALFEAVDLTCESEGDTSGDEGESVEDELGEEVGRLAPFVDVIGVEVVCSTVDEDVCWP
jgi:hypothetical protein